MDVSIYIYSRNNASKTETKFNTQIKRRMRRENKKGSGGKRDGRKGG